MEPAWRHIAYCAGRRRAGCAAAPVTVARYGEEEPHTSSEQWAEWETKPLDEVQATIDALSEGFIYSSPSPEVLAKLRLLGALNQIADKNAESRTAQIPVELFIFCRPPPSPFFARLAMIS